MEVFVKSEWLEQVERYKYLGIEVTKDWRSEKEVRIRIGMAKEAFRKKISVWSSDIDIDLRKRMV